MARNFPLEAGGGSVSERRVGQFQSGAIKPRLLIDVIGEDLEPTTATTTS